MLSKITILLTVSLASYLSADNTTIAALDLGTGQFKLLVDKKESCIVKVPEKVKKHFKETPEEMLSDENIKELLQCLNQLVERVPNNTQIYGLATELFRRLPNGTAIIQKMNERFPNVSIQIATGEEESRAGFNSIASFYPGKYSPEQTVVFESGSGSIQISFIHKGKFYYSSLPLGTGKAIAILQNEVREPSLKGKTIQPLTHDEAKKLGTNLVTKIHRKADQIFQEALREKLTESSVDVVGIGYGGLFGLALDQKSMTIEELSQFIDEITCFDEKEIIQYGITDDIYRSQLTPSAIMLHSVMKVLKFNDITFENPPPAAGAFVHFFS